MAVRNPNKSKGMVGTVPDEDRLIVTWTIQIALAYSVHPHVLASDEDAERFAKLIVNFLLKGRHITDAQYKWLREKSDGRFSLSFYELEGVREDIQRTVKTFGERRAKPRQEMARELCNELSFTNPSTNEVVTLNYEALVEWGPVAEVLRTKPIVQPPAPTAVVPAEPAPHADKLGAMLQQNQAMMQMMMQMMQVMTSRLPGESVPQNGHDRKVAS